MKIVFVFEVTHSVDFGKITSNVAEKLGLDCVKTEHHFLLDRNGPHVKTGENNEAVDKLISLANQERNDTKPSENIGGYQPLKNANTSPPQGGSGVPPHKDYPEIKTNDWASLLSDSDYDQYEKRLL